VVAPCRRRERRLPNSVREVRVSHSESLAERGAEMARTQYRDNEGTLARHSRDQGAAFGSRRSFAQQRHHDTDDPTIGGLSTRSVFNPFHRGKSVRWTWPLCGGAYKLLAQFKDSMSTELRKTPGKSTGDSPGTSHGVAALSLRMSTKFDHVYNLLFFDGSIGIKCFEISNS